MARTLYGGTPAHVLADEAVDGTLKVETTAGLTVWQDKAGTIAETDLLDLSLNPITTVTPTDKGRVWFYGKDGYTGSYWIKDSDGDLWRIDPPPEALGVTSISVDGVLLGGGDVNIARTTWDSIADKPTVVAAGDDEAEARASIGAIGTDEKNQPNGVAGLDTDGKLDPDVAAAITEGFLTDQDIGIQIDAMADPAVYDTSNLSAALASVPSTAGVTGFVAVRVAGT